MASKRKRSAAQKPPAAPRVRYAPVQREQLGANVKLRRQTHSSISQPSRQSVHQGAADLRRAVARGQVAKPKTLAETKRLLTQFAAAREAIRTRGSPQLAVRAAAGGAGFRAAASQRSPAPASLGLPVAAARVESKPPRPRGGGAPANIADPTRQAIRQGAQSVRLQLGGRPATKAEMRRMLTAEAAGRLTPAGGRNWARAAALAGGQSVHGAAAAGKQMADYAKAQADEVSQLIRRRKEKGRRVLKSGKVRIDLREGSGAAKGASNYRFRKDQPSHLQDSVWGRARVQAMEGGDAPASTKTMRGTLTDAHAERLKQRRAIDKSSRLGAIGETAKRRGRSKGEVPEDQAVRVFKRSRKGPQEPGRRFIQEEIRGGGRVRRAIVTAKAKNRNVFAAARKALVMVNARARAITKDFPGGSPVPELKGLAAVEQQHRQRQKAARNANYRYRDQLGPKGHAFALETDRSKLRSAIVGAIAAGPRKRGDKSVRETARETYNREVLQTGTRWPLNAPTKPPARFIGTAEGEVAQVKAFAAATRGFRGHRVLKPGEAATANIAISAKPMRGKDVVYLRGPKKGPTIRPTLRGHVIRGMQAGMSGQQLRDYARKEYQAELARVRGAGVDRGVPRAFTGGVQSIHADARPPTAEAAGRVMRRAKPSEDQPMRPRITASAAARKAWETRRRHGDAGPPGKPRKR